MLMERRRLRFMADRADVLAPFMSPKTLLQLREAAAYLNREDEAVASAAGEKHRASEMLVPSVDKAVEKGNEALRSVEQPSCIVGGIMRQYQLDGLRWLVSTYDNGISAILADEMGSSVYPTACSPISHRSPGLFAISVFLLFVHEAR